MGFECFCVSPGVMVHVANARRLVKYRRPNARCNVATCADILKRGQARINPRHVRSSRVKVGEPVIMATVGGIRVLVDGWHRVARAHCQKTRKYLQAHLLTEAEFRELCWPSSQLVTSKSRWRSV